MRLSNVLPVAAALPWRAVASLTGAGLLLLAVTAAWPASAVSGLSLVVAIGALAAAAAYLLDEAAAEAVATTPMCLRTRSSARLAWAAAVFGTGLVGLGAVAQRSDSGARLGLAVPLAGCILLAVACSATLRRRVAEPGELVGATLLALVVALAVARPFGRWVDLFPADAAGRWGGAISLWTGTGVVSIVAIAHALRDPLD